MVVDFLDNHVHVSTLIGDSIIVDQVYHSCPVIFMGYPTWADLVILKMVDFDIIQGMSQLSPYHAILDCHAKTVTVDILGMADMARIKWEKHYHLITMNSSLSFVQVVNWNTSTKVPLIEFVPVVYEFIKVFLADFLGMPPDREMISIKTYCRTPIVSPFPMVVCSLIKVLTGLFFGSRVGKID